ncbi:efflux RND transporter periplasmic adaptor subunit [Piscinibacter defluvii]|uniref:efflux RND transporter periplasmic adaptor subunit n=1 Tax=Piscinibacter defluvii TaxID=1796922 RepID=UPI000FDDF3FE|nr:efflux RND transporter periplasmic adaptor subunit [Piscinibacter defluvii]
MHKAARLGGWAVGVAAAAVAVARVAGFGAGTEAPPVPEPALEFTTLEVVEPVTAALPLRLAFSGPLVAPSSAVVKARAPGTLLSLAVAEGHRVRAGQALARLDLAELDGRVAERQASVAAARANWLQAERSHASNRRLADQNFISPNALDASRAALDAARAALDAAQAQLDTARVGLRDASPVAPIAGVVARRHVVPGEKLAAEQPVLTIVDLATLELAGSVGTHEVGLLEPGLAVQVQVEGRAEPVAGRIDRIAPAAEPGTRAIGVTVAVPNPGEKLRAGQYAVARVSLGDPVARLTVPAGAVTSEAGQAQVWVIEQGVLRRRAVTLGRQDEASGRVEVLAGLAPGVQLLALRFDGLREGRRAVVVSRGAALAAAAASAAVR